MKFYTSYFYAVRFFPKNAIPISTAMSAPKWYGKQSYFDKRGVINGLSYEGFKPGPQCSNMCYGPENCERMPQCCPFLRTYKKQLQETVDWEDFLDRCNRAAEYTRSVNHFEGEPIFILLVHEAPDNPCSERRAIQKFIIEHGYECEEYDYHNN